MPGNALRRGLDDIAQERLDRPNREGGAVRASLLSLASQATYAVPTSFWCSRMKRRNRPA